ncbi:MAG: NAD(P)H-binding protein, partial [Acidobacteriota bacterium]|nr:NAD(P)H-binding protein [Acidobacteriota bacterium]
MTTAPLILLTGATGYVGGRLLPALEAGGHRVRCLTRRPEVVTQGHSARDVVQGDVLERPSLDAAMRGVDVAYYLVHSMGAEGSFEEADRQGAANFAA